MDEWIQKPAVIVLDGKSRQIMVLVNEDEREIYVPQNIIYMAEMENLAPVVEHEAQPESKGTRI